MQKYFFIIILCTAFSACKNISATDSVTDSAVYYTCSMDPQVLEHRPGKCPICKMQLTAIKKTAVSQKDQVELSEQQIRLGNIHADTIRNGTIGNELLLTATLNFDQMKTSAVSARVAGRIDKLYFKNPGDYISKGAPLYELFSDELNKAKQEYLLALDRKKAFAEETVIDFSQLILSAKNKLLLWGLSEIQIQDLARNKKASGTTTFFSTAAGYITSLDIREGEYVTEGSVIVKLADLSSLWAEAQVYTSQMSLLDRSSIATVQLPDADGKEINGKIEFVNPEINPDTRINLIRVAIQNPGNHLKPGMSAYVHLKNPPHKTLSLPIDAVMRDEIGAAVWIRTQQNTFKTIPVETGLETDDRIEIVSGLKTGDVVVTSGVYLLHSEYIFKNHSPQ